MRGQARIVDGNADGEMVEALQAMIGDAQQFVDAVVEKASDARAAGACGLGLEVQCLPDRAGFPEQPAIRRRPAGLEGVVELGEHPEAEEPVGGDVLRAAQLPRDLAGIQVCKQKQRQVVWHAGRSYPGEVGMKRALEGSDGVIRACQHVDAWLEARDSVHEQDEVQARLPVKGIERRAGSGQEPPHHECKAIQVDG